MRLLEKLFHLEENNARVSTEVVAGFTTFFAMAYILGVNSSVLGAVGMPAGAVYLGLAITTAIGCLLLGLFANVPLTQSAGIAFNSFFTYVVVTEIGFTWQEALAIVFISGILMLILTVTKVRGYLVSCIPKTIKTAIVCGVGLLTAYVGLKNVNFVLISESVPSVNWEGIASDPAIWLFLFGFLLTITLVLLKVRGAFLISIISVTLIGLIPFFGVTSPDFSLSFPDAAAQLPETFGVIFTPEGLPSLFSDIGRLPLVIVMIVSFSLIDVFEAIGTSLGAGHDINLFSDGECAKIRSEHGIHTRSGRILVSSAIGTVVASVFGTSNTAVYAESAAGVKAGGRTGLTAVVVALCFAACIFFVPLATCIPLAATSPILVVVGIMMLRSLQDIEWGNPEIVIPGFFALVFMMLCASITVGIGVGLLSYCLVKLITRGVKEVSAATWVISLLFVICMLVISLIYGNVI